MIPTTTNHLLVAEDWKKIYQSYRNADFKSYDFDTLRRTMIGYLRENYPEDFNDFIDSSEYIALIDLIAYLGQNLSFRIDLNARENFLETAERRESVLRLARLINYNAKRNIPASGLLKIISVQTTDTVYDNNGVNLSNTPISWNDPANSNWFEQFISVVNAGLVANSSFGKPSSSKIIDGIPTQQYKLNNQTGSVPAYSFSKNINGVSMSFEIVPVNIDTSLSEESPSPNNNFSLIYRNDNKGNSSSNTGFFVHFKQGTLSVSDFSIDNPVPNEIIGINTSNINDSDVWLWQLNADGTYPATPWTKVAATSGNNIIYNSLSDNQRNLYTVITREQDQIDLSFADGSFGNLPKGQFKLFYRQSNGIAYTINPDQLSNISINIPYFNSVGQPQTLSMIVGLQYTVTNSAPSESNADIKTKAPQAFYSQNRMVTAEDYNIVPLTVASDILKVKAVNRISSGVSKYFEMTDITGQYSDTTVYGGDGAIYKDSKEYNFRFNAINKNEIKAVLRSNLFPILKLKEFKSFYLENYPRHALSSYNISWVRSTKTTNQTTGYFNLASSPVAIADFSPSDLKYIATGSLVKFTAPIVNTVQQYFLPNGKLTSVEDKTTSLYRWSKVVSVVLDGSNSGLGPLSSGIGPTVITGAIPTGAKPLETISKFISILPADIETAIIDLCLLKRNFGLSLDATTNLWNIVYDSNLDLTSPFGLANQNDITNTNKDASWMIAVVWTGVDYRVRYRVTEYIFESSNETSFFVDNTRRNYDYVNDVIIKDTISVLGINSSPTTANSLKADQNWQVDSSVIEPDGYQEPKKIKISFFDKDDDGQIDNPDSFDDIVKPNSTNAQTTYRDKFVYFKKLSDGQRYVLVNSDNFYAFPTPADVSSEYLEDGQLFYFYDPSIDVIKYWSVDNLDFVLAPEYFAKKGRSNLKFQYTHKSPENRRIDPGKTNLMDIYVLTKAYDTNFRNWLTYGTGSEPLPPTSQSLEVSYSYSLNSLKSISDELVFQPVKYKILFGDKAAPQLQATFKAVRNPTKSTSDNDLKTRILTAISSFFLINNWDFGQSFYFSELSTYVMNIMTPDITNFVIVPKQENAFGSLYEIKCLGNEIFVSGASSSNIEIIGAITTSELQASGNIINVIGGQV